ncbi:MAG: HDOD domain-containing protein [Planctomycetota bacterium]
MKRILVVDPEPALLQGLQIVSEPQRGRWQLLWLRSSVEALNSIATDPFDVVLVNVAASASEGLALLAELQAKHPAVRRFAIADAAQSEVHQCAASTAHCCLVKPCAASAVKSALVRGFALQEMLTSERVKYLVAGMPDLPCAPPVYFECVAATSGRSATAADVGAIVAKDAALSARLVKLASSPSFGAAQPVETPVQAAEKLGLDTLKSLVIALQTFAQFDETRMKDLSINDTWGHSLQVAKFTRHILESELFDEQQLEYGFLAGILHDIGKLVLALNRPDRYLATRMLAERSHEDRAELERRLFGAHHGALGAYLLHSWGLPNSVVEAVAFHHAPAQYPEANFAVMTAVHIADCLARVDLKRAEFAPIPGLDRAYLSDLGYGHRLTRWLKACRRATGELQRIR